MGLFSSRTRAGADEPPHFPMHVLLVLATLYAIYPVLWVLSIAFSGKQSLAIADVPSNPTFWDRLRAVIPWPADISLSNFTSVFADQPFATWILNSAIVSIATCTSSLRRKRHVWGDVPPCQRGPERSPSRPTRPGG